MDHTSALQVRLATNLLGVGAKKLTVDNTVRKITLSQGGYRLYGTATQTWIATRLATDSAGSLRSGETAPATTVFAAPAAGAPGAAVAWDNAQTVTGLALTTDPTLYEEIAVPTGQYLNLYVMSTTTTNVVLLGPFT